MILDPTRQAQILTPAVRRLMGIARDAGADMRVVGGAVRDVLLDRAVGDIDLATDLPPQRVIDLLAAQNIKTVPTGLAHGTITAVIDKVGYEITTLRRDIATDGRHAAVAFTDDWRADAARRDFTLNALYLDGDGRIYDYTGGADDAACGRIRFIGDAHARITEDVLRILRLFRFHAWFGRGAIDAEGLAACRDLAHLMPRLSAQRVAREILKLLTAPDPIPAWQAMRDCGVTAACVAEAADIPRLRHLMTREADPPDPVLRLAALLPPDAAIAATIATRLKLPNRDGEKLAAFAALPDLLRGNAAPVPLRRLLYRYNPDYIRAALRLTDENLADALPTIAAWENPRLPIKGQDIVKSGIPAGPHVGEILRGVQQWWIDGDFRADRAACLTRAADLGKRP